MWDMQRGMCRFGVQAGAVEPQRKLDSIDTPVHSWLSAALVLHLMPAMHAMYHQYGACISLHGQSEPIESP